MPTDTAAALSLAQARALRARGSAMPCGGLPAPEILDSWVRCMDAGLDPGTHEPVPVIAAGDLAQRRERSAVVRRLAHAELETLAQQIAGSNFLLAFADRDGVILDLYHDNRFALNNDAGILAGSVWNESVAGTNGLGTALATGGSVVVSGIEHYRHQLGTISCTAMPVRDPGGAVVGVLDASSYVSSRERHTQALVQMAARHIENGLLLHRMRPHWVLAVHPRPEYLGTLSAGLLAFAEDGRLLAINPRGQQLLQGLRVTPGARFDELFDEPIEQVLPRLTPGAELRLRDLMGSSLVVSCLNRPAAARVAVPSPGSTPAPASAGLASANAAPPAVQHDPAVRAVYTLAERAVAMGVPLLIHGETGSGKELLARHLHQASGRAARGGAFVAINCAGVPADLFEAELFGHVGGAFTGARREGNPGLLLAADRGTLLLDELPELPPAQQAALLRFLDDQLVRPVGSTRTQQVDVQLIAASHADLEAQVAAGRFRADLLYRLNTVVLALPPLRERCDLPECTRTLLATLNPRATLDEAALPLLRAHAWPGNFRELRAVLTRALLAGDGLHVGAAELATLLPAAPLHRSVLHQQSGDRIRRELTASNGSISATARRLGVSRTTVYRYLREAETTRYRS